MRRIAIMNQKGGVGKTTTTANVGMALARAGHRVLLIDLDPQAHLSLHVGFDLEAGLPGVYELLTGQATISKARHKVGANIWLLPSSIDLAGAEVELASTVGREVILRDTLEQHVSANGQTIPYDFVLMDCPPSLGVLTLNALCTAQEVMIPLQPHYLALQGLSKLLETVALVGKRINPALKVGGVVLCMHEKGTRLAGEVVEDVSTFFEQARGTDVPWSDTRVYETVIRRNIKLAESPSYGQSIFDYAPDSNGAKDYHALAMEIAGGSIPDEVSDSTSAESSEVSAGPVASSTPENPHSADGPITAEKPVAAEDSPMQDTSTGIKASPTEDSPQGEKVSLSGRAAKSDPTESEDVTSSGAPASPSAPPDSNDHTLPARATRDATPLSYP